MRNEKVIELSDLYLSCFISVKTQQEPELIFRNGTGFFTFPETPEVLEAIKGYQANEDIPIFSFISTFKRIRGKLYAGKNGRSF